MKHRKSAIATLYDAQGEMYTTYEDKAKLLWEATIMVINPQELIQPQDDLSWLHQPFTQEEINEVVSSMPTQKSPSLDGFNTDFIKRCWPLIKEDFYALCQGFYEENICLQSINGSYITLVPKVDTPLTVSDFRPISFLNTCIKLITKILANRLQRIILELIH